jgi:D-glucosaminate-6-phosphate ammonia-lyase
MGTANELFARLHVAPAINAAGRVSTAGGAVLSNEVVNAMTEASRCYFDMAALRDVCANRIAGLCGAEAAFIGPSAAACVAVAVAGGVAREDPARVRALPGGDWPKREIILQAGHLIRFGAPIEQMIRAGGGRPIIVGAVNRTDAAELAASVTERTAAIFVVRSPSAADSGAISLARVIDIAQERGVWVVVDAAADEDLRAYLSAGADMVVYSGSKAVRGPTSGFIVGSKAAIACCRAQDSGIGRAFKVGKETIAGLVVAVEQYLERDNEDDVARAERLLSALASQLATIRGLVVGEERDRLRPYLRRITLGVTTEARTTLTALERYLREGSPPILTRIHHLEDGWISLDPRGLSDADVPALVAGITTAMSALGAKE